MCKSRCVRAGDIVESKIVGCLGWALEGQSDGGLVCTVEVDLISLVVEHQAVMAIRWWCRYYSFPLGTWPWRVPP